MDVFVYYEHREFLLEAVMITTNKTTIHQLSNPYNDTA